MIGYARISDGEVTLRSQVDALRAAGCVRVFRDQGVPAFAVERPGLNRALKALRPGDVLVVWRLDRVGSSLGHLIDTVRDLRGAGFEFRSLTDGIDTKSATGRYFLETMNAISDFERRVVAERTRAGLEAARGEGKRLGRYAAACGVSAPTLYRELAKHRAETTPS